MFTAAAATVTGLVLALKSLVKTFYDYEERVDYLSEVFRAKIIAGLQKQLIQDKRFIRVLHKTDWMVYDIEPFAGAEQIIKYLGRFTHG